MNGSEDVAVGIRVVTHGAPLAAGTVVYRVIEDDPPEGQHTWKVAARVVERASKKQIKLKVNFTGLARTLFDPDAFGRLFFETPLQAIQAFLIERRLEAESLDRRRKEADRAITWAEGQAGMRP